MVVKLTDSAIKDLNEIHKYISLDSEDNANKQIDRIIKRLERIEKFPTSGHIVKERKNQNIREIPEGTYRIIYRVYETEVRVLHIMHSKRLFK